MIGLVVVGLMACAPVARAQDSGAAALAERFAELARDVLSGKSIGRPQLEVSTALLQAAVRENPSEPRLQRLLIDAYLETGDSDGALKAISDYRKLQPGDRIAQTQLIDIYLARMESAEQRQKYLLELMGNTSIPAEVRAHAGVKAAKVLMDRGEESQARDVLQQALALNELNGEGLQLSYELARNGKPADRMRALLALLRGNPAQPAVMARIGGEFASAGVPDTALQWYDRSFDLSQKLGTGLDANDYLDSAVELLMSDQAKAADAKAAQLGQGDPSNLSVITLHLLAARQTGDKDAQAQWVAQAFEVLADRINALDTALNGKHSPTTKPSTNPAERLPDVVADAKKLAQPNASPDLHDSFAQALIDFAWLEIYFNEKPQLAAQALDAIKILVPPDNEIAPRLEGWSFLVQKRNDEAKVKLSAVADKDPLSKAGLLRIAPAAQKAQAQQDATILLQQNATGIAGATILDALRPLGVKLTASADAAALNAELQKFPMDWLQILDTPKNFYALKAEPLKVSYRFAEPMLMSVTVQNIGKYDLSVGAQGVIRQDLWFDATLRGVVQGDFAGVAYDRLGQQLLLKPTEAITIVTRVDRGQLRNLMMANPVSAISIFFSVLTNPVQGGSKIGPGPAGFREQARSVVERAPSPIANPDQQQQALAELSNNDPAVRMCAVELFATYAQLLRNQQNATEAQKAAAEKLVQAIQPLTTDPSPAVRTWVRYMMVTLATPEKRPELIEQMLHDPQWEMRVTGLAAATILPPDQQVKLIDPIQKDADPIVSKLAKGIVSRTKATTRPATTGASKPSGTSTTAPAGAKTP
jgi:tetratricopeptide (TPR) repeat protein